MKAPSETLEIQDVSRLSQSLTERQLEILHYIQAYIESHGYPPTIREIGHSMGIRSTNGVNDHLKALVKKGHLDRGSLKSRALRPSAFSGPAPDAANEDTAVDVPILGRIAAGQPILATESCEESMKVDKLFVGNNGPTFALRVVGDSMIGDGILEGDLILVRKQPKAHPGQIVAAMIEGEATVKRYFPEGDRVRFQPSNPALEPIYVHREDWRDTTILGVVVGVFRKL